MMSSDDVPTAGELRERLLRDTHTEVGSVARIGRDAIEALEHSEAKRALAHEAFAGEPGAHEQLAEDLGMEESPWEQADRLAEEVEHYKACASSWCKQYDSMVKHARAVEANRERLRAALHEHAIDEVRFDYGSKVFFECQLCYSETRSVIAPAHRGKDVVCGADVEHEEGCLLHGYEPEGPS